MNKVRKNSVLYSLCAVVLALNSRNTYADRIIFEIRFFKIGILFVSFFHFLAGNRSSMAVTF